MVFDVGFVIQVRPLPITFFLCVEREREKREEKREKREREESEKERERERGGGGESERKKRGEGEERRGLSRGMTTQSCRKDCLGDSICCASHFSSSLALLRL